MADDREVLAGWWREFAEQQCRGYSPLYEAICEEVAGNRDVLDLVLEAPMPGRQPNVLLAAVHFLLLGGLDHPLADTYAGAGNGPPAGPAFCELVGSHRAEIADLLATRRTNTNECGRSAVLVPGLRWIADRFGEPLALLDAGTSAGLTLNLDRYLLDYGGGLTTGPPESTLRIVCEVTGPAPIDNTAPVIAARIGLDRSPVDLSDPEEARWMLACVWPDTGRLERTAAAIDLALAHPQELVTGDLIDDLATTAHRLPADAPLCVVTSWAMAYVPGRDRPRFVEELRHLGRQRPVAWLHAEGPGVVRGMPAPTRPSTRVGIEPSLLGCLVIDGASEEHQLLGRCHPHGAWLEWLASR
ncbi:MAG: DUF2332 domain-containing protein [Actinomycetota bacterium]|nr:DUF2332 domain-containing protein [Actinomycetota bacterium]